MLADALRRGPAAQRAVQLKVGDIDSQRMVLRVERGKGGHDREMPLSPTLLAALREYYRWMRPQTYLFPGTQDGWRADRPLTSKVIWDAVRFAARSGRHRPARQPAHAAPFVRHPSAGGRRRPPRRSKSCSATPTSHTPRCISILSRRHLQAAPNPLGALAACPTPVVLQILVPKITGDVVDRLQEQSIESRNMWIYPAMIMAVSLASFISHYLSRLQINGAGNLFDYETRNAMFKHLLDLSMSFFQKKATGDIMALTTNDLGALRMTLSRGIMLLADTIILSISSIIIMIGTVNLKLTLLVSIPFPFMIWVMVRFGTIINRRFRRVQDSFC